MANAKRFLAVLNAFSWFLDHGIEEFSFVKSLSGRTVSEQVVAELSWVLAHVTKALHPCLVSGRWHLFDCIYFGWVQFHPLSVSLCPMKVTKGDLN